MTELLPAIFADAAVPPTIVFGEIAVVLCFLSRFIAGIIVAIVIIVKSRRKKHAAQPPAPAASGADKP